jgi:CRP-like cAMP-binding protein
MLNNLINHFKKTIELTQEEEQLILNRVSTKTIKKRDVLLNEGELCKHLSYIDSGCIRIFSMDDDELENNIYFALEDWWAVDLKSFLEKSTARFYIQALEECELNQIYKSDFEELLEEVPKLEKWFRILLQNALISSENRISTEISLSAEERYLKFLEKYPTLESRISQKHIASYLGISPEFLSKFKSKRLKRKP